MKKLFRIYQRLFWTPEKYARKMGVKLGHDCWIGTRFFGSEPYLIRIGNHVQITSGVRFFTHGGGWVLRESTPDFDSFGKIVIGNNVYIGCCSIILPGIRIGNNVVIGAGSIVTKSFGDNVVIGGNPARVIGNIDEYKSNMLKYNLKTKFLSASAKKEFLLSVDDILFMSK